MSCIRPCSLASHSNRLLRRNRRIPPILEGWPNIDGAAVVVSIVFVIVIVVVVILVLVSCD